MDIYFSSRVKGLNDAQRLFDILGILTCQVKLTLPTVRQEGLALALPFHACLLTFLGKCQQTYFALVSPLSFLDPSGAPV